MNPLTKNKDTGFLESVTANPRSDKSPFDSSRKLVFLKVANDCIENREWPTIDQICKTVGITIQCFHQHLREDEVFASEWNEVKERLKSMFTEKLAVKANSKMGTLANLAMLRWLETGTWSPESRVQIISDNFAPRKLIDATAEVIDAELADNPHLQPKKLSDTNTKPNDNHTNG